MNPVLLSRQRGRCPFWFAVICALAIHLGAVVLAKNRSDNSKIEKFSPPDADVELVEEQPKPELPEELITPPPLEQIPPDQDNFHEEKLTQPSVRSRKKARPRTRTSTPRTSGSSTPSTARRTTSMVFRSIACRSLSHTAAR